MFPRILRGFVDVLAPPCCAACFLPLTQHNQRGFCPGCELLIDEAALEPASLDQAACVYGGPLAEAITHFKYGGRSDFCPALSRLLVPRSRRQGGLVDIVSCVPLHGSRLRERGFNQSALLAMPVARQLGLRFAPGLLKRTRATPPQAGLDRERRLCNLAGAFKVVHDVRGLRVLIVDDVATTHTTLFELRRTLRAAGAASVRTLVLARAEQADPEC